VFQIIQYNNNALFNWIAGDQEIFSIKLKVKVFKLFWICFPYKCSCMQRTMKKRECLIYGRARSLHHLLTFSFSERQKVLLVSGLHTTIPSWCSVVYCWDGNKCINYSRKVPCSESVAREYEPSAELCSAIATANC
jgi:hypothetical protein